MEDEHQWLQFSVGYTYAGPMFPPSCELAIHSILLLLFIGQLDVHVHGFIFSNIFGMDPLRRVWGSRQASRIQTGGRASYTKRPCYLGAPVRIVSIPRTPMMFCPASLSARRTFCFVASDDHRGIVFSQTYSQPGRRHSLVTYSLYYYQGFCRQEYNGTWIALLSQRYTFST
jgi:hypothetical protein